MNDLSPPLSLTLDSFVHRCVLSIQKDDILASSDQLNQILETPAPQDAEFLDATRRCGLDLSWALALKAMILVEHDAGFAQAVSSSQGSQKTARPTPATLLRVAQSTARHLTVVDVLQSPLFKRGLVVPSHFDQPTSVTTLQLSAAFLAALGLPTKEAPPLDPLHVPSHQIVKPYHEAALSQVAKCGSQSLCLCLRGGALEDQKSYAVALAQAAQKCAVDVFDPTACGLVASLQFINALPVQILKGQAGTRLDAGALAGFAGTRVILTNDQGGLDTGACKQIDIVLPSLDQTARNVILAETDTPQKLGDTIGLGPTHLREVVGRMQVDGLAFRHAAGQALRADLEPHAVLVETEVETDALVAPPAFAQDLDVLLKRCENRRAFFAHLGPAFAGRSGQTGVRALFAGPSGGGKTLACAWLATQLNVPLFKVDLSSVVSKYIGETEENLSRILDAAEAADVILLFDEADALFGARTEAKDSSDRYANNQTNFLLGRIETYRGIIVMTTNGRQRLDTAFGRRIDQVIDVPVPDAHGRRSLWKAHLGEANQMTSGQLNKLANGADLAGGHIRSVVRTAAVLAGPEQSIGFDHIKRALAMEYSAMGRTPPATLRQGHVG